MNWAKANGKNCSECRSVDSWPGYDPAKMQICRHAGAILRHGGPRSCSIVRGPGGLCAPEGLKWVKRT